MSALYKLGKQHHINIVIYAVVYRGAGTILYVGEPTNQNKCCGKSGGGDQYIGGPPRF